MNTSVSKNLPPIIVSVVALLIALFVGLIPVWQNSPAPPAQPAVSGPLALVDLTALEDRVAALEAAAAAPPSEPAPAAAPEPAGLDPALRAEIDMIVKGLVNQTGRVSRLKKEVAALTESAGQTPPRVEDEIALAKRALVNLTRRLNAMDSRLDALDGAPAALDRLALQMTNVEKAVTRIGARVRDLRSQPARGAAAPDAPATETAEDLARIAGQLEALLQRLDAD